MIATLRNDVEGIKTSVEKLTAVVEIARELEIEVGTGVVIKLLQPHNQNLKDEDLLIMDEQ